MDARSTATLQQIPAGGGWTPVVVPGSAGERAGDEVDVRLVERLGGPARRATS